MKEKDFYRFSEAEKKKLISVVSDVLQEEQDVVFAYMYGSFMTDSICRDIDIFIFISDRKESFTYASVIKEKVFDAVRGKGFGHLDIDDFDVRILNDAPYDFAINILTDGSLIADKDAEIRTDYIERISDEYRVNHFILDEAFSESR